MMKKYIKWKFFISCLGLILYLNLQDARTSMALSNKAGEVVASIAVVEKTWIQKNIRKLAHTGEYFLLGISTFWCFGWKSLFVDAEISFADQCFKGLIPIRHFDWTDFPFDIVGYVSGCLMGWGMVKMGGIKRGHINER